MFLKILRPVNAGNAFYVPAQDSLYLEEDKNKTTCCSAKFFIRAKKNRSSFSMIDVDT